MKKVEEALKNVVRNVLICTGPPVPGFTSELGLGEGNESNVSKELCDELLAIRASVYVTNEFRTYEHMLVHAR